MKIGSLFTGYGGLDLGVMDTLGGQLAWVSDVHEASVAVTETHFPTVPNLGDVTRADWGCATPVDILTGGYPCQPFSLAGHRRGITDERHLWPYMRNAISFLQPKIVVMENVRGHLSLGLREVLHDLAGLGYAARWGVVRASDAGAPHGRSRLFILAYPDGQGCERYSDPSCCTPKGGRRHSQPGHGESVSAPSGVDWKQYERAIARWERILGRPAPVPYVRQGGLNRVNAKFTEWLMGLPDGWVTGPLRPDGMFDIPKRFRRSEQMTLLGNGVVPQQAGLAIQVLMSQVAS